MKRYPRLVSSVIVALWLLVVFLSVKPRGWPDEMQAHASRSGHWPTVRKHYLESHPVCAACGRDEHLEVHHRKPFHTNPDLEMDEKNLITLCRRCHEFLGHLDKWASWNADVAQDAANIRRKIETRP